MELTPGSEKREEEKQMGEIIPFPVKKTGSPDQQSQLTDSAIREKILAGEAELIGVLPRMVSPALAIGWSSTTKPTMSLT